MSTAHRSTAPRVRVGLLLFGIAAAALQGCSASPVSDRASADPVDDAGGAATDDGGDAAASTKTCPPGADFDSDPDNCGRCGRVCDDGVCTHGVCNPRTELDLPGTTCVGDLVVHGGRLYAAMMDGLVTVEKGRTEKVMAWPYGPRSVRRCLASDGKNLWAAMAGRTDIEFGDERLLRFAHFDEAGVRGEDLVSPEFDMTTSFLAAGDGRIAQLDVVGSFTFVDEAKHVQKFDFGTSPSGAGFAAGDFFVGVNGAIVRVSKTGSRSYVLEEVQDRLTPWTVTADGIVDLDVDPDVATLRRYPLGGGAATDLATITVAQARDMLATVAPGVETFDATFDGWWKEPEGLVFASGSFYFSLAIPDRDDPAGPHQSLVILRFTEGSGVSLFALVGDTAMAGLRLRAGRGRLTWREGGECGDSGQPDRTLVRSSPL